MADTCDGAHDIASILRAFDETFTPDRSEWPPDPHSRPYQWIAHRLAVEDAARARLYDLIDLDVPSRSPGA